MLYLHLFYTFFKIGLFGFGGGYAMLSMIQGEVVTRYGWLTPQEFTDIVAISQMTPGPIGINSATYVGFTATGSVWGSIIATFAVVLPSFILMLTISKFFLKYQKHPAVEAIFAGLRPAVVGLLASAALVLMNAENFGSPTEDTRSFIITIDFIGYLGTLALLLFKEFQAPHIDWTSFYNGMSVYVGIACCVAFAGSIVYIIKTKYTRATADKPAEAAETAGAEAVCAPQNDSARDNKQGLLTTTAI